MKRLLLAVLFCAGCAALAQAPCSQPAKIEPLQVKVCPRAGNYSQPCDFDARPVPGDLIVVAGVGGCGNGTCETVFDNLGNRLKIALVVPQYNGIPLWFEPAPVGFSGVTFAPVTNWWDILLEYPPSTGLDDAAWGSYTDAGLTPQGVQIQDNSGWAGVHRSPYDRIPSPVETHESCELLISWTLVGGPAAGTVQAGPNFTLRANNQNWLAVEDSTTTIPGYFVAGMRWHYPTAWDEGLAAFKMGNCK